MAKIENKKLLSTFMMDVQPHIDNVLDAYKLVSKPVEQQKGGFFEAFDKSLPKTAIFEADKKNKQPIISDNQIRDDLFNRAGSLISNLKYNNKDLVIIAKSITEKYLSKNTNPIDRLRDALMTMKVENDLNKSDSTGVVLLSAYLLGLLEGYDPRGAGFLFESFIAGIVGASGNNGTENGFSDVTVDGHKLSLKFLSDSSSISNAFKEGDIDDKTYYIVAIKNGLTSIKFYVIHINDQTSQIKLKDPIIKKNKDGIVTDTITHAIHYTNGSARSDGRIHIINNDTYLSQLSKKSDFEPVIVDFKKVFFGNLDTIVDEAVNALHYAYQFIDNLEKEVFDINNSKFTGNETHSVGQVKQSYDKTGSVAQKAFGDEWK